MIVAQYQHGKPKGQAGRRGGDRRDACPTPCGGVFQVVGAGVSPAPLPWGQAGRVLRLLGDIDAQTLGDTGAAIRICFGEVRDLPQLDFPQRRLYRTDNIVHKPTPETRFLRETGFLGTTRRLTPETSAPRP